MGRVIFYSPISKMYTKFVRLKNCCLQTFASNFFSHRMSQQFSAKFLQTVMHQSNRSLNIPPLRHLTSFHAHGGRNLTPGCVPGVGHLNVREGVGGAFEQT